jgi:type III restriction enzyme
MFQLKQYQEEARNQLIDFFQLSRTKNSPSLAFEEITQNNMGISIPYRNPKELDNGVPYICFRIPTGGGKTFVACHTIAVVQKEWLDSDSSVILWLAPTTTIVEQTLKALKNDNHFYRQSLNEALDQVYVWDIEDVLKTGNLVNQTGTHIIVSTIQAFRTKNKKGRRVFSENSHYKNSITNPVSGLICYPDTEIPIPCLANYLKQAMPVVIVDEAHNVKADLSMETLVDFNPSCILEFTATPETRQSKNPSNILYTSSAAELASDDMIKMPIRLEVQPQWESLLKSAIDKLAELESLANSALSKGGKYIRPIMLVHAESHLKDKETLTPEFLKDKLINLYNIPESQIAIATGSIDELGNQDVLDKKCPIRFIITIQKLKEGWDCPFAYVLCSVAQTQSPTAMEQILGRVMRLPYVERKKENALNKAYAFVSSNNFRDVLDKMKDAIVEMGFEKIDAKAMFEFDPKANQQLETNLGPLFDFVEMEDTISINKISDSLKEKVDIHGKKVHLKKPLNHKDKTDLLKIAKTENDKIELLKLIQKSDALKPEQGDFSIPLLTIKQDDLFEPFEEQHLLEHDWNVNQFKARLDDTEYSASSTKVSVSEIYQSKGYIKTKFISQGQQLSIDSSTLSIDIPYLVLLFDKKINHPDISADEMQIFLLSLLTQLNSERNITIDALYLDRIPLQKAIEKKINEIRKNVKTEAYQELLFKKDSMVRVTENDVFTFNQDKSRYPLRFRYSGAYEFRKHYYLDLIGDLKNEGEEFQCARFIDTLEEVEIWVRNLDTKPKDSFWLQTATDKFYPDFICKLKDGRFLVVEYKGKHLWSNDDSKEKRRLGGLWEKRSNGKCLFIMPNGPDFNAIEHKIRT